VLCKKRLKVPSESRNFRSYDILPINPCDITFQNTVLVCTELVLIGQHCPSQATSRFYAEDFPLWLYNTLLQVLQDLKQRDIILTRRFRLQSIVTRRKMTESLKRMFGWLGVRWGWERGKFCSSLQRKDWCWLVPNLNFLDSCPLEINGPEREVIFCV
jgi:hypothetical protein